MTTLNDEPLEATEPVASGDPFGPVPSSSDQGPRGPISPPPTPSEPGRHGENVIWMVAAVGVPLITVWLLMGSVIIWRAANDQEVLESIEGLLTALAVLTIPATQFIQGVLRKWNNGSD